MVEKSLHVIFQPPPFFNAFNLLKAFFCLMDLKKQEKNRGHIASGKL
jgi:hypothetical protein